MAKVKAGVVLGGLSGRAGNAVFAQTAAGTVLRDRPFVNNPRTPAQTEARARLAAVSRAWKGLDVAQATAWRDFAAQEAGLPAGSRVSAQLVFNRLGAKLLQANPGGTPPTMPPANAFPGDAVRFTCAGAPGAVEVTADLANAAGVVTEVLLQRLPSIHCRTYRERYRTAVFHRFAAGETLTLEVRPGAVAVATRFVDAVTGQATELIEWGVVA
mgnify:CR=1 FL=1